MTLNTPALGRCVICGQPMSTHAYWCQHCGQPNNTRNGVRHYRELIGWRVCQGIGLWWLITLLCGIALTMLFGSCLGVLAGGG